MTRTLKTTLVTLAGAVLVAAAGLELTAAGPQAGTKPAAAPNTLTAAEKAAGWRLLFDGKTTAGWRGFKKTDMPAGWTVEDGALTRSAAASDIVTIDEFENFELIFDWRIAEGGNSGVFGRATEESTAVWHSTVEYQILHNQGHADGKKPETTAGSAYALYAPVKDVTKAPGEWNTGKIVMKGAHVEHWLNGVKLLEFEIGSKDWNERVTASKFAKYTMFGKAVKGRIALQDHGDKVAFRNIKIRIL